MTESEIVEIVRCYQSFTHFCEQHVYVEDKNSHAAVKFKLWPCQQRVADLLVSGEWLEILKARRLGLTWLLCAYAVWLITVRYGRQIVVVNQDKEYAQDFLERVRFIHDRLPPYLRATRTLDNKSRIDFNRVTETSRQDGGATTHGCVIRSVACTKRAIRSLAADLIVFDEAAYMPLLKTARLAAQPAVETGGGQIVLISTSNGPSGDFHELWMSAANRAAPKGKGTSPKRQFTPVFLHWSEHPARSETWYAAENDANKSDPLYMKREYPASPEEAFESADGRIYPLFSAFGDSGSCFIRSMDGKDCPFDRLRDNKDNNGIFPSSGMRYRSIDFGGVDPFVCLWGMVIPGDGPALTIEPCCTQLIRELLAYSYDQAGRPGAENNHTSDALRYMIITPGLNGINGHLHIYRELYLAKSAAKGLSLPDLARQIVELSGAEVFEQTIAARSRPDSIGLLCQMGIPSVPQRVLSGGSGSEIVQGITRVNALIVGAAKGALSNPVPEMTFTGLSKKVRRRGVFA